MVVVIKMVIFNNLSAIISKNPHAKAIIKGSDEYPHISGEVRFYSARQGVIVACAVKGLPASKEACMSPVLGFHIHEGESCTGNETDPFADAFSHYNPENCQHPYHAGDMPPLLSADGIAVLVFSTDRFTLKEVCGKTVIIHAMPDDFRTQPSGNSGKKIACGKIIPQTV